MDGKQNNMDPNYITQLKVSKQLFEALSDTIVADTNENEYIENLKLIYSMITDNLTFGDPGLFSEKPIQNVAHQQLQESTNMWLLNYILNELISRNDESLKHAAYSLQKEIFLTSFIKQRDFFTMAFTKYHTITDLLQNAYRNYLFDINKSINISIEEFHYPSTTKNTINNKYDISAINTKCEFKSIQLQTIAQLTTLLINNIKVMTSVNHLDDDGHGGNTFNRFSNTIMECLECTSLNVKGLCLDYFSKLLSTKKSIGTNKTFQKLISQLLEAIRKMIIEIQLWKNMEIINLDDLKRFNKSLLLFLNTCLKFIDKHTQKNNNNNNILQFIDVCLMIITKSIPVVNTNTVEIAAYNILIQLMKKTLNIKYAIHIKNILLTTSHINTYHRKAITPKTVQLFEMCILTELIECNGKTIFNEFNSCITDRLTRNQHDLGQGQMELLEFIKSIITVPFNVEHEHCHWHQLQHLQNGSSSKQEMLFECRYCGSTSAASASTTAAAPLTFSQQSKQFTQSLKQKTIKNSNILSMLEIKYLNLVTNEFLKIVKQSSTPTTSTINHNHHHHHNINKNNIQNTNELFNWNYIKLIIEIALNLLCLITVSTSTPSSTLNYPLELGDRIKVIDELKQLVEFPFNSNNSNNNNNNEFEKKFSQNFVQLFGMLKKFHNTDNIADKLRLNDEIVQLITITINFQLLHSAAATDLKQFIKKIIKQYLNTIVINSSSSNNNNSTENPIQSSSSNHIFRIVINLLVQNLWTIEDIIQQILLTQIQPIKNHLELSKQLHSFICLLNGNGIVFCRKSTTTNTNTTTDDDNLIFYIKCEYCDNPNANHHQSSSSAVVVVSGQNNNDNNIYKKLILKELLLDYNNLQNVNCKSIIFIDKLSYNIPNNILQSIIGKFFKLFKSPNKMIRQNVIKVLPKLIIHSPKLSYECINDWIPLFGFNTINDTLLIYHELSQYIQSIHYNIQNSTIEQRIKDDMLKRIFDKLLSTVLIVAQSNDGDGDNDGDGGDRHHNKELQLNVLEVIRQFGICSKISENYVLHSFMLTFYFFLQPDAAATVADHASLIAKEICNHFGLTPRILLTWYNSKIFTLLIQLCVCRFFKQRISFEKSIEQISSMLGYDSVIREFFPQNYQIIITCLLPHYMKYPELKIYIEELCTIIQLDLDEIFRRSFLSIYTGVSLNVNNPIRSKCLEYVYKITDLSLYDLLKLEIRKSIAETLLYYNKNPEFVIDTLKLMAAKENDSGATSNSSNNLNNLKVDNVQINVQKLGEYISTRFMGILTYFEQIFHIENEKTIQIEAIRSLGGILRFMGSAHIINFFFKILAVLRTALTINNSVIQKICADVWKIFIFTVDINSLGSYLSLIVISLETLLAVHPQEANEILYYLIVTNSSLLSAHIGNLFFFEDIPTTQEIKQCALKHMDSMKFETNFTAKLHALLRHTNHEHLGVRIYALKYLYNLLEKHRNEMHYLILSEQRLNGAIVELLDILMICCKHSNDDLRLLAGKCLGILGAIDPSHLPPNYAPQCTIALSANSDGFAKLLLPELCRAYQCTKYVDSFSLAFQEIFVQTRISLETNTKLDVWECIPERMRSLMIPLLTSCYSYITDSIVTNLELPVFASSKCTSVDRWAFVWASNMIETINDETIKHLLKSFKPCIKSDIGILYICLSYIILHALQMPMDESNAEYIYKEFMAVFRNVNERLEFYNNSNNIAGSSAASNTKRYFNTAHFHFLPNINNKLLKKESSKKMITTTTAASTTTACEENFDKGIDCAKLALNQLDFLNMWMRRYCIDRGSNATTNHDVIYLRIKEFCERFDKKYLAYVNFECGEYARALMYIEAYIEVDRAGRLQNELSFLSQIYAELLDSDSLTGALNIKLSETTLTEQILLNQITNRLQESTVCFEKLIQSENITHDTIQDMVQCYLGLDQPKTALTLLDGMWNTLSKDLENSLLQASAEPLWRLCNFDQLNELLQKSDVQTNTSWGFQCGEILINYRKSNVDRFSMAIDKAREMVLKQLRASGDDQTLYHKGYTHIMKLNLISEIENCHAVYRSIANDPSELNGKQMFDMLFSDWDTRLELLQPTVRCKEPVLCLRRILLNEMKMLLLNNDGLVNLHHQQQQPEQAQLLNQRNIQMKSIEIHINEYIGKLWLKSTELARNAGMHQQAYSYIINAQKYQPKNLFIEKAKLFWNKHDQIESFQILERGLQELCPVVANSKALPNVTRKIYAEGKLLIASYNAQSMLINSDLNQKYFKSAIAVYPDSEINMLKLAQYLDSIYAAMSAVDQLNAYSLQLDIMTFYGQSMAYGCNFIYQSMPRMLTIWFDFTERQSANDNFRLTATRMCKTILQFLEKLPRFIFFTAFSQLISRICHPSPEVYSVLKTIIITLIEHFPQQSMWMILSVYKSSYSSRIRKCTEIFSNKRLSNPEYHKLIGDFNTLAEYLIELTNKELQIRPNIYSLNVIAPKLPTLFQRKNFSKILMPIEKCMQPILPPSHQRDKSAKSFNAFPQCSIYIHSMRDEVVVLPSLQRPRRVTFIGSDGKSYIIMMKPKDDLRKDYRLMEFNHVVNQYLHQDPDARQRRLKIRTYSVLPLNEECGILEWVPNLNSFRQIMNGIYAKMNTGITAKELQKHQCLKNDSIEKKRLIFESVLLPKHPSIFSQWFSDSFTTPYNWYQARCSYVRTLAVMSMVGYILGLGDRHGENVLFDTKNGDVVHVDFNCLFNKGETFEIPETVPFRLTHNLINAMGPLGIDGPYRKCCEITLKVLQDQKSTLNSVLRPFVYDPLVSWGKSTKTDGKIEKVNSKAMVNVKDIANRLDGLVKINDNVTIIPLSAEGVVKHCIMEATNIDNLAAMYIGWGAFL